MCVMSVYIIIIVSLLVGVLHLPNTSAHCTDELAIDICAFLSLMTSIINIILECHNSVNISDIREDLFR